MSLPGLLVYLH